MRVRPAVLIALGVLPALLLLSCSGGGETKIAAGRPTPTPRPTSTTGPVASGKSRVEGYVFISPSDGPTVLGRTATPPPGYVTAGNATISVEGVPGSVTTDAQGFFLISDLAPGNYLLTVPGALRPTASLPITLFAGATTTVGEPKFTRQQAIDAVKARLAGVPRPAEAALFGPQQPLPVGTTVAPALGGTTFRADRLTWFFYADLYPTDKFSHSVKYYFVDAESGTLTEQDATSWPGINDLTYYKDISEYESGQDLIQKSSVSIARSQKQPDAGGTRVWYAPGAPRSRDHVDGCSNGKVHVLIILGDTRPDFVADADNFAALARTQFHATKIVEYRPVLAASAPNSLSEVRRVWREVRQGLGPCDTLFVLITTHGLPDGTISVDARSEEYNYTTPGGVNGKIVHSYDETLFHPDAELDLLSTQACHVILHLHTCYSGKILESYKQSIESDTSGTRWGKKIAIVAECAPHEVGAGRPNTLPPPGGFFSVEMVSEYLNQFAGNPTTYIPTVEGTSRAFDNAALRTTALSGEILQGSAPAGLHPVKYIRTPPSYEQCGVKTVTGILVDEDLKNAAGQVVLAKGTKVPLFRLEGDHASGAELPVTEDHGCTTAHLHANSAAGVKFKDANGNVIATIPDPRPSKCGYGTIIEIPIVELFDH